MTDRPTDAEGPASTITGAVAFTDIVSFTEFTAIEGDHAAYALVAAMERIVAALLPPGSRIIKYLGDGQMLWFPDAQTAVSMCLNLLEHFDRYSAESSQPLWVRIGLHWGRQTMLRDDLIGHDVNLAARISQQAGASEILLSEDTVEQAGEAPSEFQEIGPVMLKGIPEPVRLFRVVRAWPSDGGSCMTRRRAQPD